MFKKLDSNQKWYLIPIFFGIVFFIYGLKVGLIFPVLSGYLLILCSYAKIKSIEEEKSWPKVNYTITVDYAADGLTYTETIKTNSTTAEFAKYYKMRDNMIRANATGQRVMVVFEQNTWKELLDIKIVRDETESDSLNIDGSELIDGY